MGAFSNAQAVLYRKSADARPTTSRQNHLFQTATSRAYTGVYTPVIGDRGVGRLPIRLLPAPWVLDAEKARDDVEKCPQQPLRQAMPVGELPASPARTRKPAPKVLYYGNSSMPFSMKWLGAQPAHEWHRATHAPSGFQFDLDKVMQFTALAIPGKVRRWMLRREPGADQSRGWATRESLGGDVLMGHRPGSPDRKPCACSPKPLHCRGDALCRIDMKHPGPGHYGRLINWRFRQAM